MPLLLSSEQPSAATHITIPRPTVITQSTASPFGIHPYTLHTVPACPGTVYINVITPQRHHQHTRLIPTLTEYQHQLSTPSLAPTELQLQPKKCLARRSTQRVLNTYLCPFVLPQTQISAMLLPEAAPVDSQILTRSQRNRRCNKGPNKQHYPH